MQIVESGDDCDEPRFSNGSMSCLFPLTKGDSPRKSITYNKLHQHPLRLAVLKLDGSSFEIEVAKSGTVGELKRAVESAFSHLPKTGPGRVSWEHVWGQFCLCHEGQKLLTDSDYISMFGIKDGDQLQFVHHASNTYNLVKIQSEGDDPDSDDEPRVDGQQNSEKDDGHHIEILKEDNQDDDHEESDDDDDVVSRCECRLINLLKGLFPYRKLSNTDMTTEERSSSPRSSHNTHGSFKNCLRFSNNKKESRRENSKGK
ncbi:hypothetical protein DH2020_046709 [Rehmannia glutinosa]|uniref:SNRNP25 ubiquitin-like domain-containing protein n=1 Tax=Rehmannia glutinosa TaxID=99300 RepID=A0ABR0UAH9_REHGL